MFVSISLTCHLLYFISGPGTKCVKNSWHFIYFAFTTKRREAHIIDYHGHSKVPSKFSQHVRHTYPFLPPTHCATQWSGARGGGDAVSMPTAAPVTVEETRATVLWFSVDSVSVLVHPLLLFSCL